jgi:hypothetical protein
MAHQKTICDRRVVPDFGAGGVRTSDISKCWPDATGGWVVIPDGPLSFSSKISEPATSDPMQEVPYGEATGKYFVARLDATGKVVKRLAGVRLDASTMKAFALMGVAFDYDGDGVNELILLSHVGDHSGGGGSTIGKLWTYHGKIEEIKVPFPVVAVVDADNDGRPDLLANGPYSGSLVELPTCGTSFADASTQGPFLLMHSLPGSTFSVDDMAAQNFARSSCSDYGDISQLDSDTVCNCQALRIIRCERLRGVSAEALLKAIEVACKSCDSCPVMDQVHKWANAKPPLVLK